MLFPSWLLYDLAHLLLSFPALGAADTVAHHAGFICASAICGAHRILPFAFGWLIVGELSSPLLNVRWLLIHAGRRRVAVLQRVNVGFARLRQPSASRSAPPFR